MISTFGVPMMANKQLKQVIDRSQDSMCEENGDALVQAVDHVNIRPQKTGLAVAYAEDFKDAIVADLRSIHICL